jgi:two-component system sensor kinase FixL
MRQFWASIDKATSNTQRRPILSPYLVSLCVAILATTLNLLLNRLSGEQAPHVFAICAVIVAALYGGCGPGLLSVAAGVLFDLWAYHLRGAITWADEVHTAAYVILGVAMAFGGDFFWRSHQRGFETAAHLSEREAHLQSILDTVPDAMIIIDDRGQVRSFSPAAERTFGWTAEEVRGRNVSLLMPSPDREAHDSYLANYLRTGEAKVIGNGRIVRGRRKDGESFPMELSVAETGAGGGRFFTGFVRDLSERFNAEGRMRELQNEMLHMSRLTAMGEMAATLAHELNQPLSASANFLNAARKLLAADASDLERINGLLEKAADQMLRGGQIIRRLREFVGRGESQRQIESLVQLLREACALALVGAGEVGVTVRTRFDAEVDLVLADKVQIQQVVLNLLRNAIDAMQNSEIRELSVAVRQSGDDALVEIVDTGPGISGDIADKLFHPFMTTKANGMGVGLSISKTIIEAHGGRIWADANPQGGARFSFTLPRVEAEAAQ